MKHESGKRSLLLKIMFLIAVLVSFSQETDNYRFSVPEEMKITVEIPNNIKAPSDSWGLFIEAIIWKESGGEANAIGDGDKAVGVLQLHEIMVDDANRISELMNYGVRYTYDDRFSREKSIEMFNIVQDYYNKERDMKKALDIWNSGHPDSYCNDIFRKYEELVAVS